MPENTTVAFCFVGQFIRQPQRSPGRRAALRRGALSPTRSPAAAAAHSGSSAATSTPPSEYPQKRPSRRCGGTSEHVMPRPSERRSRRKRVVLPSRACCGARSRMPPPPSKRSISFSCHELVRKLDPDDADLRIGEPSTLRPASGDLAWKLAVGDPALRKLPGLLPPYCPRGLCAAGLGLECCRTAASPATALCSRPPRRRRG